MNAEKLLKKVTQSLSVTRAFGTAYESGGTMVIPVAFVAGGGGAGEGTGTNASSGDGPADLESEDFDDTELSGGSGGGFGGTVMPIGVYVVSDDDVRWVPAINANLLIIAGLLALRMLLRTLRSW